MSTLARPRPSTLVLLRYRLINSGSSLIASRPESVIGRLLRSSDQRCTSPFRLTNPASVIVGGVTGRPGLGRRGELWMSRWRSMVNLLRFLRPASVTPVFVK